MNKGTEFTQHLVLRYLHNVFIIHFEVGPNVALLMNDIMRSLVMRYDTDFFQYCITRAKNSTPHYLCKLAVIGTFFRSENECIRYQNMLPVQEIRLQFSIAFWGKLKVHLLEGNTLRITLQRYNHNGNVQYWIEDNTHSEDITERQFHQEIDNVFTKFTSIPITYSE